MQGCKLTLILRAFQKGLLLVLTDVKQNRKNILGEFSVIQRNNRNRIFTGKS